MQRCNRIYNHPIYISSMERIKKNENGRRFCLHNLQHALDTARIGYIHILENGLDIDKELFYAAALLHDAGRYSGKPHNESGAELAERIMPDCGFTESETAAVASAIRCHRIDEGQDDFSAVLYMADKKSRICFECEAATECYWPDKKRNHIIEI